MKRNPLKTSRTKLDSVITLLIIVTEALMIARVGYAWDTYTQAAKIVWGTASAIVFIILLLQLYRLKL